MRFLKIFGTGFILFAGLVGLLLVNTQEPSTRDGIGFLIVFGVIFYLPVLFIVALVFQLIKMNKND